MDHAPDQVVFWFLFIILIICVVWIYKLFHAKKQLFELCQEFINKISENEDYLILDTEQAACLPDNYRRQTEKLMMEMSQNTLTMDDFVNGNPDAKLLLIFGAVSQGKTSTKKVIGMLKFYPLYSAPHILEHILEKVNPSIIAGNPFYVSSLIIDQRYRGRGFGGKMLEILFEELKHKKVLLEVKKINDPAVKLYRKMGFNIVGQNKDEYLMKKFL